MHKHFCKRFLTFYSLCLLCTNNNKWIYAFCTEIEMRKRKSKISDQICENISCQTNEKNIHLNLSENTIRWTIFAVLYAPFNQEKLHNSLNLFIFLKHSIIQISRQWIDFYFIFFSFYAVKIWKIPRTMNQNSHEKSNFQCCIVANIEMFTNLL